ncbi:hypothetical protein PVN33_21840, partial [Bacillus licheniformis]|uniref:hypothetical protein n=1 Tax=Bacillus licheniformis TaxID=1402 RepID=UPI00237CD97C
LKQQSAVALGTIVTTKRAAVTFTNDKNGYTVDVAGFASAKVSARPDGACCKQPNDVGCEPLPELDGRKVGYPAVATCAGGKAGAKWDRANENSAFYGSFGR